MTYEITHALLDQAMTAKGGYTRRQLAALGLSWPPTKGWRIRLEQSGGMLTQEQFDALMADSLERKPRRR